MPARPLGSTHPKFGNRRIERAQPHARGWGMSIDFKTLFLLTLDVEAMLGILLLFSWMQNTAVRAVAWWGCANLLRSLSIGLYGMYGVLPDAITITAADVILFSSYAVTWTGARIFDARAPRPGSLITVHAALPTGPKRPAVRD